MLLAGDIGGTRSRLALIDPEVGAHDPLMEKEYKSAVFDGLEGVIDAFCTEVDESFERASFGVAGPVVKGSAKVTNLPWVMDEDALSEASGIPKVTLLNDLEATAYGVLELHDDETYTLNEGSPSPEAAIAVIAPGTGLGEAFLTWNGQRYDAHPSEGGHADFGPMNQQQIELLTYLWADYDHVSYEWVCSGIGIPNVYAFLRDSGFAEEPPAFAEQLAAAEDKTPLIAERATGEDALPLCTETMNLFAAILGAEAANLALKVLSTNGLYLGGGIPPRILPLLEEQFMAHFLQKGRFNNLLEEIPVHVVLNPKTALIGAASHAIKVP
jgi:glucokinase